MKQKMSGRNKYMIFSFKAIESDESDLDDEDIAMINKNLKNLFKKDDAKDMALMAMEDSESDTEKREANLLDLKNKLKYSKCDGLSNVMIEMTLVDDTSTLVPHKIEGESILGVSKIEEVLEDIPCEGEYFGDPTVEQSSVVRLNSGSSSEGESMRDPSVEPSSSIGIHINCD
ncbi:hypothetical protein H5410_031772 [Solanum commersonii]|uniref:Uncharacterized protein n=1 Tax=Solanum commersonii TaxID=4109 RepID=A0A9J5YJ72_SOLCO|nr:hypothetical protein H5410_031772 [Solanum commersonii]